MLEILESYNTFTLEVMSHLNIYYLFKMSFCFPICVEFEDRKCEEIIKIYCKSTAMDLNVLISIVSFNGINEEIEKHLKAMFPFDYLEMEEGMKYLSFILKPNGYGK